MNKELAQDEFKKLLSTVNGKKKYITVVETSFENLDIYVNNFLSNGWELYDNQYAIGDCICQPMIKIIENTIDEPVNKS